mgnify:CR=1 FL=1
MGPFFLLLAVPTSPPPPNPPPPSPPPPSYPPPLASAPLFADLSHPPPLPPTAPPPSPPSPAPDDDVQLTSPPPAAPPPTALGERVGGEPNVVERSTPTSRPPSPAPSRANDNGKPMSIEVTIAVSVSSAAVLGCIGLLAGCAAIEFRHWRRAVRLAITDHGAAADARQREELATAGGFLRYLEHRWVRDWRPRLPGARRGGALKPAPRHVSADEGYLAQFATSNVDDEGSSNFSVSQDRTNAAPHHWLW